MKKLLSTAVSLLLAVVATAQTYTSLDNAPDGIYRIDDGGYIRAAEHVIGLNSSLSLLETQLNFVVKVPNKSYSYFHVGVTQTLNCSRTDALHTVTPANGLPYKVQHFTVSSVQLDATLTSQSAIDDNRHRAFSYGSITMAAVIDSSVFTNCPVDCRPVSYSIGASTKVYKDYAQIDGLINTIVGNPCVSAGEQVTFSVSPHLNYTDDYTDTYYWDIPASLMLGGKEDYYSYDHSSVTFTLARSVQSGDTIRVRMGKYNQNKPTSIILPLNGPVPEPQLVQTSCFPFGANDVVLKISNTVPDVTYNWSFKEANGWQMHSSIGDSIVVTTHPNLRAQILVTAISDNPKCQSTKADYWLTRSFAGSNGVLADVSCANRSNDIVLTMNRPAEGVNYNWEVPDGWTYATNVNEIVLTPSETTPHTSIIRVSVAGCDTTNAYVSAKVTLRPAEPIISDNRFCVTQGSNTLSLIAPNNQNDTYRWSFPNNNWSPRSNLYGTTVSSTLSNAASPGSTLTIRVTSPNSCYIDRRVSIGVAPTIPQLVLVDSLNSQSISNERQPNIGSSEDFYIKCTDATLTPGATYRWNIPSALSPYVVGGTSKSYLHLVGTLPTGVHNISLTAHRSGACGNVTSENFVLDLSDNISVNATMIGDYPWGKVFGVDVQGLTGQEDSVAITAMGVICLYNDLYQTNMVMLQTNSFPVVVYALYPDGHSVTHQQQFNNLQMNRNGRNYSSKNEKRGRNKDIQIVYPNPASSEINVKVAREKESTIYVYSKAGSLVYADNHSAGQSVIRIQTTAWEKGLYSVVIGQGGAFSCVNVLIER